MMSFIVSFNSTTQAMMMQAMAARYGLPGRIIPVPRQLTASCGMAWAAPEEAEGILRTAMDEHGISFAKAVVMEYRLRGRYGKEHT